MKLSVLKLKSKQANMRNFQIHSYHIYQRQGGGGYKRDSNFIFWFQFPIYFGQDIIAQVSDVAHVPLVSFLKAFVNTFCITKIALMPSWKCKGANWNKAWIVYLNEKISLSYSTISKLYKTGLRFLMMILNWFYLI